MPLIAPIPTKRVMYSNVHEFEALDEMNLKTETKEDILNLSMLDETALLSSSGSLEVLLILPTATAGDLTTDS